MVFCCVEIKNRYCKCSNINFFRSRAFFYSLKCQFSSMPPVINCIFSQMSQWIFVLLAVKSLMWSHQLNLHQRYITSFGPDLGVGSIIFNHQQLISVYQRFFQKLIDAFNNWCCWSRRWWHVTNITIFGIRTFTWTIHPTALFSLLFYFIFWKCTNSTNRVVYTFLFTFRL